MQLLNVPWFYFCIKTIKSCLIIYNVNVYLITVVCLPPPVFLSVPVSPSERETYRSLQEEEQSAAVQTQTQTQTERTRAKS